MMPDTRELLDPGAPAGSDPRSALLASGLTGESAAPVDAEQAIACDDRALSRTDRTRSECDQAGADADQLASDRDQASSDRHLANGGDPAAHAISRDIRRRATHQREQTKRARLLAAAHRDEITRIRDLTARVRDLATERRDALSARALR